MNTFTLDQARNLPQGTIKRVWEGDREYLDIEGKRVPLRSTPRQVRLALLTVASITPAHVEAVLDGLPEPQQTAARIEWEYATFVDRIAFGPLGVALGLSETDIDDVFVAGEGL